MKKTLFLAGGNVAARNFHTFNDEDITLADGVFSFPEKAFSYLESVSFYQESAYNVVSYAYRLRLSNVTENSRFGLQLKGKTDNYNGENVTFVFESGALNFYVGNTLIQNFGAFDIAPWASGADFNVTIRRENDKYILLVANQSFEYQFLQDGTTFRQNVCGGIYGSDISIEPIYITNYTEEYPIKFGLLGDSIANGYAAPGGYAQTIGGIMKLEKGLAFNDFAGSANVLKDSLDSIAEIALIRPKYAIIMYGHNDILFNTGRLESDYFKLIETLKNYGIIPIPCTMCYSNWVDITPANDFVRSNFFNDNIIHIELFDTLNYPADYVDIAHPNTAGNRKLAERIFETIQSLP